MTAKDAIRATFSLTDRVLNSYLEDLSDAELLVRPVEGQNHIAWQLGHLIASEQMLLDAVKPGASPALPEGFAEAHGRDEASTRSDDPARFLPKARYLDLMQTQRQATLAALDALTDAEMDGPAPERFQAMLPNVGAYFTLIATHPMMHAGQFVSVRRKLNKKITM